MKLDPILPIWLMAIICVGLLVLKRKGIVPYIRQIVIVLLLFCINLRIMIPDQNHVVKEPKIDAYVLFVLDDTLSMLADDMPDDQTRLECAVNDCGYIVDKLGGSSFGVISFNNQAQILTPYTNDPSHIKSMLKTVTPLEEHYAQGSSFNLCQELIVEQIEVVKEKEDTNVYVFFISDGENNKDEKIDSFKDVGKHIDGGAVLGYGTSKGGNMTIKTKTAGGIREEIIRDSDGNKAVSKLDEKNLNQIADEMGVEYVNVKESSDVDATINGILDNVKVTQQEKTEVAYLETYYYFLPPLIILLLWDFVHFKRKV